jgi:peptidoglycan hydrolase CwlO-like protein
MAQPMLQARSRGAHTVVGLRVLAVVSLLAALAAASVARGQSEGALRSRIEQGKAAERSLSAAVDRLTALEHDAAADVAALEDRVADVQAAVTEAEELARQTAADLVAARTELARLERRLAEVRTKLAAMLRERYVNGEPSLVSVVLNARGFSDLVETASYLHRVQRSDERLLVTVRTARAEAERERSRLTVLSRRREETADALARRRDALAGVLEGLRRRRDALARARDARQAALSRTRAGRRDAERELRKLLAEQAAAAVSLAGPGGPWAIPWAIVQCESGGQNLPPNSAGASGYYQFLPSTWQALGGSTPQAYQASKEEQDRLAAQLWAGGAGARNWVCAGLV